MLNRYRYLREYLSGRGDPTSQFHEWAINHAPLLSPTLFAPKGRRINNFCVGSDPEFSLAVYEGTRAVNRFTAWDAGLKVGLAAGCDQNERLVELRPCPSTSVVAHVTGILTTLRWMYRVCPQVRVLGWRAGAFFAGDGMGGHIHFGRKRPTRKEEVEALDGLARVFTSSQLFPNAEWVRRIRGDEHGQIYGAPGDIRVQKHGYEYRSLPSWLVSPTVAFIAIASSKLALLDPSITSTWIAGLAPAAARNHLRGLAKLYRSRDDDSYLLYHLLTQQGDEVFHPAHTQDFSVNWGFQNRPVVPKEDASIILPASIPPDPTEVEEMAEHLIHGAPLQFVRIAPNFTTTVPEGYYWLPVLIHPGRRSGFGDLIHNLVGHSTIPVNLNHLAHGVFQLPAEYAKCWSETERQLFTSLIGSHNYVTGGNAIVVTKAMCQTGAIDKTRALLVDSGLFPLWTVETVTPNAFPEWVATHKKAQKDSWRSL